MSNPNSPESPMRAESGESFGSILSQFERSHAAKAADGLREGTVVSVSSDSVFIDLGLKTEGILPLLEFQNDAAVKPGDKLQVTIKGRDPGGYYYWQNWAKASGQRAGLRNRQGKNTPNQNNLARIS